MQDGTYYWAEDAKCRSLHPDVFDLEGYKMPLEAKRSMARRLCEGCPVIAECAKDVLKRDSFGLVRAGLWTHGWMCGGPTHPGANKGALVRELKIVASTGKLLEPKAAA